MSTLQSTPRLSLFEIESELLQLIDAREDALERRDAADEAKDEQTSNACDEELQTITLLLQDYVKREIRKVDSTAYAIKEFEARAAARKAEAEKMLASADRDAETAKRIKAMVLEVMQEFDEKKLPGRLFAITRQGNGGLQALTIAQPDLVPLGMKRVTIDLVADLEEDLRLQFGADSFRVLQAAHPDQKDIREALERGEGVMGCKLEDRAEHIRIK